MKDFSISSKQAGFLTVICILANKVLVLPSLLFEEVGADGFFVLLALIGLDFLMLWAFFMLKSRYPTESFYQILRANLGKVVAVIIFILLLVFFLFKSLFSYSVSYMFLRMQVYQDELELLAIVCILPIINHAVLIGLRAFSRTIEFFYYIIITGLILCLFISLGNNIGMPIFLTTPPQNFLTSMYKHIFSFGDYIFLFLIMDKIELKAGEGRKIFRSALFGNALLLALYFLFYSIFRVTAFMHNNALSDIISVSSQYSSVGRIEIISMLTVIFLTFFQLMIFVYSFTNSFVTIFPRLNKIHGIVLYDLLFFILYVLLLGQYDFFIGITESYLSPVVIFLDYVLAIIAMCIAIKKGRRRKYEKIF